MASVSTTGNNLKICSGAAPSSCRNVRSKTVCSGLSRRESLSLGAASVAAIISNNNAKAIEIEVNPTIKDKENFFQIYEARDIDLPQQQRFAFGELTLEATKARLKTNAQRIADVEPLIVKKYFPDAQASLRGPLGTIRFDIRKIAATLDKPTAKSVLKEEKALAQEIEDLDFALRIKDLEKSMELIASVKTNLASIVDSLV